MTLLKTPATLNNSPKRSSRWISNKSLIMKKNKKFSSMTTTMAKKKSMQSNPRTWRGTVKNRPMVRSKLMEKSRLYSRRLRTSVKKENWNRSRARKLNWNRLRVKKVRRNKNSTLITTAMANQMR